MARLTADLVDVYGDEVTSCETQFINYGGRKQFEGPIQTLKVYEDNALIKATLSRPGRGAVLVIDGGASLRCALVGDVIAGLALQNGWVGLVISGAIRDSVAIGRLDIGVKALGTNPRKSTKTGAGDHNIRLRLGSAIFSPGYWLYSDEDGILVSEAALA